MEPLAERNFNKFMKRKKHEKNLTVEEKWRKLQLCALEGKGKPLCLLNCRKNFHYIGEE